MDTGHLSHEFFETLLLLLWWDHSHELCGETLTYVSFLFIRQFLFQKKKSDIMYIGIIFDIILLLFSNKITSNLSNPTCINGIVNGNKKQFQKTNIVSAVSSWTIHLDFILFTIMHTHTHTHHNTRNYSSENCTFVLICMRLFL